MTSKKTKPAATKFNFMPVTLSLETLGGLSTPLVLRGTPLPTRRTQVFSTAENSQLSVDLHACLGERPMAKDNLTVARVKLEGLDPAPAGKPQIAVTFEVDESCAVTVTAVDRGSGKKISVDSHQTVSPISLEVVQRLLDDAEQNRRDDEQKREKAEVRSRAESAIRKADSDLQQRVEKGMLGTDETKGRLVAELGLALDANDYDEMKSKTLELQNHASDFHDILASTFSFPDFDFFSGAAPRSARTVQKPPRHAAAGTQSSAPTSQGTKPVKRSKETSPAESQDIVVQGLGAVFGGARFPLNPNLCFVLMPFGEDLRPVYDDHIRKVVEAESFTAVRADDLVGTGSITLDIWENVNRARFLIADLTGKNPNVFYEVGLAHALGKDVILLTQTMDDVPFDLKSLRCLVYSFTPRGMKTLEEKLRQTIQQIMRGE